MTTLAIVPARAGSKRLPGKNLLPVGGKPLLQWTLEAARASRGLDTIVVTSDDPAVLDLARAQGVQALPRPATLATDEASTVDVILHVLQALAQQDLQPDTLCLLQPTSPLRTAADIDTALEFFLRAGRRPVLSVCEVDHPTAWCGPIDASLSLRGFAARLQPNRRSQEYDREYRLNGALYIADTGDFVRNRGFLSPEALAYIMPRERSVDIDTALDLRVAEAVLSATR